MNNKQLQVLRQRTRKQYVKINLLNKDNIIVAGFNGVCLGGNISISNKSAFRRSGSISVSIKNENFLPSPNSYIWFDKKVNIRVGIENYQGEIIWFNLGNFAYTDCNIVENIDERIINLELADYMSFLDGTLGGIITSKVKLIDKSTKINQAVKAILDGFCSFSIENTTLNGIDLVLPYRIEKNAGISIFELLNEITNLYMGYEMFFDTDGFFIFQKIRNTANDAYIWDFDELEYTISRSTNINFSNVKNDIWIYGHTDKYGVQIIHNYTNRFSRNTRNEMENIFNKNKNDICFITSENKSYVFNGNNWEILSFNVIPTFNVENIGLKSMVLNDNKMFTIEQAKLNAEYQLFSQNRFANTISLSCIPLFALDVNSKIRVKGEDYTIDTIDVPLAYDGEMNITASKILK